MNIARKVLLLLALVSLIAQSKPPFIMTSVPKGGTHLLFKVVNLLTDGNNLPHRQRATGNVNRSEHERLIRLYEGYTKQLYHLHYDAHNLSVVTKDKPKILFIYRDPRDQIASFVPFIRRENFPEISWRIIHNIDPVIFTLPDLELQRALILNIKSYYDLFIGWKDHPQAYAVRFEDLVGPKGGGSLEAQLREIINIGRHIGIHVSRKQALEVADKLFGNTWTFRKGQIGAWKTEFSEENKQLFKEHAGQLLIDLGYERDFNW